MFNKKILSASIAMIVTVGSVQVLAQDAMPDEMIEEIVVSGIRESLTKAMDLKRKSTQVTDSIVAEDIGKLPDNSVAAALQRVTGVQITRVGGEASRVLIRGLPNVATTLNGREVFTAAGRGIALADVPADLLQGVDVKKSASASDIEGGVAGLVDVRLRRPFDLKEGFTAAGGLREEKAVNADAKNPIGSLTLSSRNEEFGVMLSVSSQQREFNDNARTFVNAQEQVSDGDIIPGSVDKNIPGQPSYRPGVIGSIYELGDRERSSSNLVLQWHPSDNAEYYAELFNVKYKQDSELNFWVPLPNWGPNIITGYFPGTNVAQSTRKEFPAGTISSNQALQGDSLTSQAAVGGKWIFDDLTVKSDLSYTKSEAHGSNFILDSAFIAPITTYSFSKDGSGVADTEFFNSNGTAYNLADPKNYVLFQYFDNRNHQKGESWAWATDAHYDFGDNVIQSFDFGVRLSDRKAFNESVDSGPLGCCGIDPGRKGLTIADFPGMVSFTPNNLSKLADLTTSSWLTPSANYLRANKDTIRAYFDSPAGERDFDATRFYDNEEKNYSLYGKANFELADAALKGEIGGRVVRLQSTLNGNIVSTVSGQRITTPVNVDKTDTEFLPSLNIRYNIVEDLDLVGGLSKTLTRPNFELLNPGTSLIYVAGGSSTVRSSGSGGNPNLEPIKSSNFDLSLEWYFAESSSLTGGYFYRKINGYIENRSSVEPYLVNNVLTDFDVTRPASVDGSLKGFEVSYTQFFTDLPGAWSGLGVQLNGTHMTGETENPITQKMNPIVNVSENAFNAVLIYEYESFSSRLAYNWRDSYVENHTESFGAHTTSGMDLIFTPTSSLDLSISYELNDNITFTADGVNLNESIIRNYRGSESDFNENTFTRDVGMTETTYSVGVRFKY